MRRVGIIAVAFFATVAVFCSGTEVRATIYSGNGNSNFGGALGQGSITLTDNGTTVSGVFTRGPGSHNNTVVIYIDSKSGGFSTTSGFTDAGDDLRRAVSGIDGGSNRSTYNFASGFEADYAIALHNDSFDFGNNFELVNSGGHTSIGSVNLSSGSTTEVSYSFDFDFSEIGMGSAGTFTFVATYISNTGFSSNEAVGTLSGASGWGNTQTFSDFRTYTSAVPEPSALLAIPVALLVTAAGTKLVRRYRARGKAGR